MANLAKLLIRSNGIASWRGVSNYVEISRQTLTDESSYLGGINQLSDGRIPFRVQQYKLRVICRRVSDGGFYDSFIARRESKIARFEAFIYRRAHSILPKLARLEGFIYRTPEGEKLPDFSLTANLFDFLHKRFL